MMDWWHIATVAVLMCVFACEAIYAFYAQRARFEPVYATRSEALLLADLPKRGWWEKPFTTFAQKQHSGGGMGIDAFTEAEFILDAKAVEATHIARGVGAADPCRVRHSGHCLRPIRGAVARPVKLGI